MTFSDSTAPSSAGWGIGGRTVAALRDYVERFRGGGPGALFLTRRGEAMRDGHSLYVLLSRLARRVGLARANPHRFRYSFATWAIASGARELDVQLLLGHSSPQMTQLWGAKTSSAALRGPPRHYRGWHATGGSSRHPPRTIVAD